MDFGTRRRSARGDRLWRHVGGWFGCGVVRRIVVPLPMQLTACRSAWRGRNVLADDGVCDGAGSMSTKGRLLPWSHRGDMLAGALWPLVLQLAVGMIGWRSAMLLVRVLVIGTIVPLAAVFFRTPPEAPSLNVAGAKTGRAGTSPSAGLTAQPGHGLAGAGALLLLRNYGDAAVAYGGLLQRHRHRPSAWRRDAIDAAGDRIYRAADVGLASRSLPGGLATVLCASASMALAMVGCLVTQNEIGLFSVSAVFGMGFRRPDPGLYPGRARASFRPRKQAGASPQ